MSTLLVESTSIAQPTGKEGHWKSVLITPGVGSSGTYTESMLKEYGPIALRKGAKSFVTHNRLENGEPDPFSMWGFLTEDSYYEDGVGLVGEIEVLPSWRDKIAEVAPHTALSIYVVGEADADGNITKLLEDAQNGCDLVVHPGRPGSGLVEKLYETAKNSADADNGQAGRQAEVNKEKLQMDELKALIEALSTKVDGLGTKVDSVVALSEASSSAAADKVDAFKVADELSAAVAEAKLPEMGRKRVLESVKAGTPVADAVAGEKAYIKAISESIAPVATPSYRLGEAATTADDFSVNRWDS